MDSQILPMYAQTAPNAQQLVDILKGSWACSMPKELNVTAGSRPYFENTRVKWVASQIDGGLVGKAVLELGPFEGYDTFHLAQSGASPIVAVEGSSINFFKCLIVRELLKFEATFLYGELNSYLRETADRFDLCLALGVLYHQTDPLSFLALVSKVAPRLLLWTHYWDPLIAEDPARYPHFEPQSDSWGSLGTLPCRYHCRSYRLGDSVHKRPLRFSGGSAPHAFWMERDDIFRALEALGFTQVTVRGEDKHHAAGPTLSLFAAREE